MTNKLKQEVRERFLKNLIKEAVINVLAEQEEMTQPLPPEPIEKTTPVEQTPVVDSTQEPFTVDTMVEKLNILRGGRSFKDPEVYGRLTTFFRNLTDEQKNSIEWLLNELTKIVVDLQPSGQQQTATAPPQAPAAPPTPPEQTTIEPTPELEPEQTKQQAPIQPR